MPYAQDCSNTGWMFATKSAYAWVDVSTGTRWATGGSAVLHWPTPWLATGTGAMPSRLAPLSSQFLSSKYASVLGASGEPPLCLISLG